MESKKAKKAKIKTRKQVAPTLLLLGIEDEEGLSYEPGEYITILLPDGENIVERPFSIASAPASNSCKEFELIVSIGFGGVMSSALEVANVGEVLEYHGPTAHMKLGSNHANHIFVAKGSGIAPFRAILPTIINSNHDYSARVYFVGTKEECDFFSQDLSHLAATNKLHLQCIVDNEASHYPDAFFVPSEEMRGRGVGVYLCGPKSLRLPIIEHYLGQKIPKEHIYT